MRFTGFLAKISRENCKTKSRGVHNFVRQLCGEIYRAPLSLREKTRSHTSTFVALVSLLAVHVICIYHKYLAGKCAPSSRQLLARETRNI